MQSGLRSSEASRAAGGKGRAVFFGEKSGYLSCGEFLLYMGYAIFGISGYLPILEGGGGSFYHQGSAIVFGLGFLLCKLCFFGMSGDP